MPNNSSSAIVAQGLTAAYGHREIWRGASFAIERGEFIAILGPNGSGKSTLLRLVLGLLPPAAGTIEVLGRRPQRGNADIGYVPQRRNIDQELPVRGRDFVQLGIDGSRWGIALATSAEDRQRVDEAVASVDANRYADRPIGRLSGGEQQRLLLAQALAGRPKMLLLDEPLASLDLRNQIVIAELVADLARANGLTVLLIAHDINPLLRIVDRVLYVAHGGIAIGKPADVITSDQLSRLYDAPVEVLHDSHGHLFVVGLEAESAHHDA
jgi:zinc/manganese transport system ATP-binding protein